jgi:hypothetical protein
MKNYTEPEMKTSVFTKNTVCIISEVINTQSANAAELKNQGTTVEIKFENINFSES